MERDSLNANGLVSMILALVDLPEGRTHLNEIGERIRQSKFQAAASSAVIADTQRTAPAPTQ